MLSVDHLVAWSTDYLEQSLLRCTITVCAVVLCMVRTNYSGSYILPLMYTAEEHMTVSCISYGCVGVCNKCIYNYCACVQRSCLVVCLVILTNNGNLAIRNAQKCSLPSHLLCFVGHHLLFVFLFICMCRLGNLPSR